ncbi:MAG: cell envelope integrity protein CreD [Sphingomonadales bacterium]|jgi:inner membrane protein|nr:cell envelope integrity protein CreD [Sphingomonadales bacterium]MBK9003438.1 cell envelope integrity protein CreD [Sphingomonadales bacterium]MBK9268580.1 cell envelope integrity protein CreD [Sphingomonadales bacterium]MBP6434128.1 cell envelope integrity protein CreD [Sphingorhabdus sp.]
MTTERSPGWKLFFAGLVALILVVPLVMVYALAWDRQEQANTAQDSIAAGWGGPQVIVGPVLVIPYTANSVETVDQNGRQTTRTVQVKKELFLSPESNAIKTELKPDRKKKSIYDSVLFVAANSGKARFALPADFARYGIPRENIDFAGAELRFGVSDARGLQKDSRVEVNGTVLGLQPGKGLAASNNSGFFSFVDWTGAAPLDVSYSYAIRGNKALTMVPRGGETTWDVKSSWPSPSFAGDFLPTKRLIKASGFSSSHAVTNLALGQAIVATDDNAPPMAGQEFGLIPASSAREAPVVGGPSQAATIGLIEPVDLYSQVDRSVKYGFLFIGFTFLAFLMFDVVGGARVAAAEYLLTGAGLVLFFVMLLAFAEVVGFTWAYLLAAGAITALLTAYSAAVLKSWLRARVIGGLLIGLYATLYVLLNLEAYSLIIGSLLLFVALAAVMWATRHIDWGAKRSAEEASASAA